MFEGLDFSLIVNFFVAIGTILLAIFAYENIVITQKQLRSFQDQTRIFVSQNQPVVRCISFNFRQNLLNISLTNLGAQPAFDIGYSTICLSLKKVQDEKTMKEYFDFGFPNVHKEDVCDFFQIHSDQEIVVIEEPVLLVKKEVKLMPIFGITFLKRENGESILSHRDEIVEFKSEPYFLFDTDLTGIKKENALKGNPFALQNYSHRRFKFEEMRDILKQNKIRYVQLKFSLYCKDSVENPVFQNEIQSCIVDLDEDKSIEDAEFKARKLVMEPVSHLRFVKDIGSQPLWMYEKGKWKEHSLTDEEKEKRDQYKHNFQIKFPR